ncbi:hypothetical protein ES703_99010 [subsurface metagenome]
MAESTLSITLTDIRLAIAHMMGIEVAITAWDADQTAIINLILKRGLLQFYFPPPVIEATGRRTVVTQPPYEWSFLKPVTTLDLIGSYVTGTIALTKTDKTVTLTTGVWPSWTATNGTLVVNNVAYAIASRTNDTEIELSEAWAEDDETAASYILRHDGNYDLPDDFGGLEGDMVYPEGANKSNVRIIGEGKIRSLRAGTTSRTDPQFAAIRPKVHTTTTVGQRFEIMFFPAPSVAGVLSYKMLVLPSLLVTTTITHPYGGAMHGETILASCLAVVESQEDERRGLKWQEFMDRLAASIQIDKRMISADHFGYNRDNSDSAHRSGSQRHPQTFLVTYNGET